MADSFGSLWRRAAGKPPRQLLQTIAWRLARRTGADEPAFPLLEGDIWDSSRTLVAAPDGELHRGARIGWVVVPPMPGSGGHTSLFRMVAAAGRAGYRNTLLFYDAYNGDFATNVERLRRGWPRLECGVADVADGAAGFDAVVASSWPTAHVVASRTAEMAMRRFYFLQDYEPDFYARGSLHALAEDTYRFGLTNISLGPAIAERLRTELSVNSREIVYGTDRSAYTLDRSAAEREGVAFFARRGIERRGYRLGVLALRLMQQADPTISVHAYGDAVREPGLRVINHGTLTPPELNGLYNRVRAGLVLSFTNVSLVPAELAAAGAVPVLNEFAGARAAFDNPGAVWAAPTPAALAEALVRAVRETDDQAIRATSSWPTPTWDDTAQQLLDVFAGDGLVASRGRHEHS